MLKVNKIGAKIASVQRIFRLPRMRYTNRALPVRPVSAKIILKQIREWETLTRAGRVLIISEIDPIKPSSGNNELDIRNEISHFSDSPICRREKIRYW